MMFYTHILFSLILFFLYLNVLEISFSIKELVNLIIITLFSIMPDIDNIKSIIGDKVKIISYFLKHRGFFHSIYVPILLAFFNIFASIGYLSHILLDMLNPKGIRPFNTKFKIKGRLKTNSLKEILLNIIFLVIFIYLIKIN